MKYGSDKQVKGRDQSRGGENTSDRALEKIGSGSKGSKKVEVQPAGDDKQSAELAKRGMSSEEGAKHWKATGLKVPTSVHENHHGGKK
jgi:hypothetical protein